MPKQMSLPASVALPEILDCERLVWEALIRGDQAADAAALHPEFLGVYPSGFANRQDHVAQLAAGPSVASYHLSDARILDLGPTCQCLSYRARFTRPGCEHAEEMYVSSIWQWQGEGWINIFSQDTPLACG